MKKIIVGIGELLWDVFPDKRILGGAPANFAYHVSQLGFEGYAVSAIGNDSLGTDILNSLESKHLNHIIEFTNYPTGTVQVTLNKAGIPQYEICENVAWDNIPFTHKTEILAQKTAAVCFGSLAQRNNISQATIKQFLSKTPEDCLKIFDINLRQHFYSKQIIEDSLDIADILKINDEEIKVLSYLFDYKSSDEQEICVNLLKKHKLNIITLTKGTEGSFIFTENETSFLPTPDVKVADTVGAGDSFTAAFIVSYLQNKDIHQAHNLAVKISAYVCQQQGAMPELPSSYIKLFR